MTTSVAGIGVAAPVEALLEVLRAEVEAIEALDPLLGAEERALRMANPGEVLEALRRAGALVDQLVDLDARRRRVTAEIAGLYDVASASLTLSRIAALVPAAAMSLARVGARLRQALERLLAQHRRTTLLVDDAVRFVERLVAQLGEPRARTYAPSGRPRPDEPRPRRFVREA